MTLSIFQKQNLSTSFFSYFNFNKNTKTICFRCLTLPSLNLLRALKLPDCQYKKKMAPLVNFCIRPCVSCGIQEMIHTN